MPHVTLRGWLCYCKINMSIELYIFQCLSHPWLSFPYKYTCIGLHDQNNAKCTHLILNTLTNILKTIWNLKRETCDQEYYTQPAVCLRSVVQDFCGNRFICWPGKTGVEGTMCAGSLWLFCQSFARITSETLIMCTWGRRPSHSYAYHESADDRKFWLCNVTSATMKVESQPQLLPVTQYSSVYFIVYQRHSTNWQPW